MTRHLSTPPRRRFLRAPVAPRRAAHAGRAVQAPAPLSPVRLPTDVSSTAPPGLDSDRALQSLALENALLARELGRVQQRCSRWRDDCIAQVERLQAALMRSRAAVIARDTHIAALRDTLAAPRERVAGQLPDTDRARPDTPRRVLCVGGRARQIPVYRSLVERHGGVLEHVDGAGAEAPGQMERILARADVVILQAGYACRDACRTVEGHCAARGKPCIWLDKPCAIGFERSLAQALSTSPLA